MSFRYIGGFLSPTYNPLQVPNAPTVGTATAGEGSASITFTPPTNVGGSAITSYQAISTPGNFIGTAASSPVTVTGLSNGTSYTFKILAVNAYGPGPLSAASNSVTPADNTRAIFGGGTIEASPYATNVMDYVTISTTGNATDFGDLASNIFELAACASSTRGLFGGGYTSNYTNAINYITIASTGNSTSFGQLTQARFGVASCSSSTRGIWAGGGYSGGNSTVIDYVTIASTGNATNFGSLTVGRYSVVGCSSPTRGVFGGGQAASRSNVIDYITIASTGNATDFGDLWSPLEGAGACSSSTRALFAGGRATNEALAYTNVISYITIDTTGNSTDFGDLNYKAQNVAGASSATRGLFGNGFDDGVYKSTICYVTISSLGNATNFGNLTIARYGAGACSNGHGGLA